MAKKNSPLNLTLSTIEYIKQETDSVILFYSGGKDSIVLLDILTKHFKVNLVFMYFVPELEHIEKYVTWAEKKYNVKVKKYPHWMLSQYFNDNYFTFHYNNEVPNIKLGDIENKAKIDFNCEWIINGAKKSDSLNRRLMLKTYFMQSINLSSKKAFPLSDWKKGDCLSYIKQKKLPMPISYGTGKSNGADLNLEFLTFCKEKYPNDYRKIINQFPLAETILK